MLTVELGFGFVRWFWWTLVLRLLLVRFDVALGVFVGICSGLGAIVELSPFRGTCICTPCSGIRLWSFGNLWDIVRDLA